MSEFKEGDYVRVIDDSRHAGKYVGEVVRVALGGRVVVDIEERRGIVMSLYFKEEELKAAPILWPGGR